MATRTKKTTESVSAETASNDTVNQSQVTPQQNGASNDKQSQLATVLVGLLIIASGLLIYNYFQKTTAPDTTSQTEQQNDDKDQANKGNDESDDATDAREGQYTVMPGDSLWSIAESVYGDGFQWTKIRDANELENNAFGQPTVEIGQVINVPDSAAVAQAPGDSVADSGTNTTVEPSEPVDESDVAGVDEVRETPSTAIETYTVQHGDTLWNIAESVYGDGDKWELIYNDSHNQIGHLPNGTPLLHSGNVLFIPPVL